MLFAALSLLGLISLERLPVELLPEVVYPEVFIAVQLGGTSPEQVERDLVIPIEAEVGKLDGVVEMTSTSLANRATVRVSYAPDTDMKFALLQIQSRVSRLQPQFPPRTRVVVQRFDTSDISSRVMTLQILGEADLDWLRNFAENEIRPELEAVDGVVNASVQGGRQKAIAIVADPVMLEAHDITLNEINVRLGRYNRPRASLGTLYDGSRVLPVSVETQFSDLEAIKEVVLKPEIPLTLGDVARVYPGVQRRTDVSRVNGKAAIAVQIQKEDEANLLEVATGVAAAIEQLNRDYASDGIELVVTNNQADLMGDALNTLKQAALVGILLGLAVLFLFLRTLRFVAVLLLAIPTSLLLAFNLFYAFGLSMNVLSLCGLALAVGMLADNSIVVMESIFKHFEAGKSPEEAARAGTREVGRAVVAATSTTVVVFLPVVFITSDFQDILTELALSITFPVLASLVVALLLVPALASRTLSAKAPSPLATGRLIEQYTLVLKACLRNPARLTIGIGLAFITTLGLSFFFMLQQEAVREESQFTVYVDTPEGTTLEATDAAVAQVEAMVRDLPDVDRFTASADEGLGSVTVMLLDRSERPNAMTLDEIKAKLDDKLVDFNAGVASYDAPITGGAGGGRRGGGGRGGGRGGGGFSLQTGQPSEEAIVRGYDFTVLRMVADDLTYRLEELEQIDANSVRADVERSSPEVEIIPDAIALFDRRLETTNVLSAVEAANPVGFQTRVAFLNPDGTETPIDLRTTEDPEADGPGLAGLRQIPVQTTAGLYAPLAELARVRTNEGRSTIIRTDQSRRISVQYKFTEDVAESQVLLDSARETVRSILQGMVIPSGVTVELVSAETDTIYYWMMAVAALLIYMILASLFESLGAPLIVFCTIPTAVVGSCWALLMTETGLTSQAGPMALLGFVVLLGIAVNNGIILIDAIGSLRAQRGFRRPRAVLVAGRSRVRPILMTSATTLLGVLPLSLEMGGDFEIWPPFAITVLGGLAVSMLSTLIFIPVTYVGLDRTKVWLADIGLWGILIATTLTAGACYWIDARYSSWFWTGLCAIPFWLAFLTVVWSGMRIHRSRQAASRLIESVDRLEIRTLTKLYGGPGRLRREWARFDRRADRIGLSDGELEDPAATRQSLHWKVPLLLLIGFFHVYLEDSLWMFVLSALTWAYLRHLGSCVTGLVCGLPSVAARVERVWRLILPVGFFSAIHFRVQTLSVTIASVVLFLILTFARKLADRVRDGRVEPEQITGKIGWLKRGMYRGATSLPLIGVQREPFQALGGVTLSIEKGMFGLLGPNGAGKTTLMRILCQVLEPSYGSILVNGHNVADLSSTNGLIGYLPQHFGLYNHLSAGQYLTYRALLEGFREEVGRTRRVHEILEEVNLLDRIDDPIGTFSGGMKQRVGIAQTLLHQPQIIVVDEPTAGLDPIERIRFRNLLSQLSQDRVVLFSTHIVEDISGSCNQLAVLNRGQVLYNGAPDQMRSVAEGKVWEALIPEAEFERREGSLDLITHVRSPGGIRARFLAERCPDGIEATSPSPNLEDAYVCLLRKGLSWAA
jgi:multidrug efflux pump subunit AcrB/ABC-type multidrug transport system ATPase subunit